MNDLYRENDDRRPNKYIGYCCLCHSLISYEANRHYPLRDRRHSDSRTYHPSLQYLGSACHGRVIPLGGKLLFRRMPVPERWNGYQESWYYRKGYEHGYRQLVEVGWMRDRNAYQAGYQEGKADFAADKDVPTKSQSIEVKEGE